MFRVTEAKLPSVVGGELVQPATTNISALAAIFSIGRIQNTTPLRLAKEFSACFGDFSIEAARQFQPATGVLEIRYRSSA